MNNSYYVSIIFFGFIIYLICTDKSIAEAFFYLTSLMKNKMIILQWRLRHSPEMPWVRYSVNRRSMKLAKELLKEMKNEKFD